MKLIIGNKNYSSWSLRAWLFLRSFSVDFEEVRVALFTQDFKDKIENYSPAGLVPALIDGDLLVWDSLAICEYVSEQYLDGKGWPDDVKKRARARACCAEMHSGFFDLRNDLPMNCRATGRRVEISSGLKKNISRIESVWTDLRRDYSSLGPYLFGEFSIVDCFFAPVVFRFNTYQLSLANTTHEYMENILQTPSVEEWRKQAQEESEIISYAEVGV